MARFLKHVPCDNCGSSDAGAIYDDGSRHCFACKKTTRGDGEVTEFEDKPKAFVTANVSTQDIPNRGLTEETCRKFGYYVGEYNEQPCHIANYRDDNGNLVAQKIRMANKQFAMLVADKSKPVPLYGQHLFSGGKSVVITEGEIDALTVSQAFGNKWPVVSLPNGASSAKQSITAAYEWLDTFEKIVLCFDQDEAGQKATEEVLELLPPGKAHVMRLPLKDANEVLLRQSASVIVQAYWTAKPWRPDGIVAASELREEFLNPDRPVGIPYPFSGLNERLKGLFPGKLVTVTSGSGLGKSTFAREVCYDLLMNHGQTVGGMFLEESNEETMEYLVGIHINKNVSFSPETATPQELADGFDAIASKPLYLWDHFGSNDIDVVLSRARYMVKVLGVQWLILDHLSILISGMEDNDERKTIDLAMTKLRQLCEETGVGMILISHLKRPPGDKGHEDGAEVRLGQLRGSHSIGQLSDVVISLAKDPEDPMSDTLLFGVLKARKGGRRGPAGSAQYNVTTGRLLEFL
jgi:twinkle protein